MATKKGSVKGDYSAAKEAVKKNYDPTAAGKYATDLSKFNAGDWAHMLVDIPGRLKTYGNSSEYATPGSLKRGKAQAKNEAITAARTQALQKLAREKSGKNKPLPIKGSPLR